MKTFIRQILAAFLMGCVVPAIVLAGAVRLGTPQTENFTRPEESVPETSLQPIPIPVKEHRINLMAETGEIKKVNLETYLCGVVMAEMPADFEPEALKAQAVVARTYAVRLQEHGGKHENGAVCTDPACCQGYLTEEEFMNRGGTKEGMLKIRNAVLSTAGQVLTYGGKLIEATYFSCSGGTTEDAQAVWGYDVPYLQSTESPGEEQAACFRDSVCFTSDELESLLGISLDGNQQSWFGTPVRTHGGGVESISICGTIFSGVELRRMLGLRSTNFRISADDAGITFTTLGYGHRVGMSQYGADAMALDGKTYDQILMHYYRSTELIDYSKIDKQKEDG